MLHQRIVQKAVDDGVPLNSHNIPSKKQLADMAYSIRRAQLPGADPVSNVPRRSALGTIAASA